MLVTEDFSDMAEDRAKFTRYIASMLRQKMPLSIIELTSDQQNIIINGRYFDVENVFRMSQRKPEHIEDLASEYLDKIILNINDVMKNEADLTIDEIRSRIMPRIHSESVFGHLDRNNLAHAPYVNGAIIAFVFDTPALTVSITRQQLEYWDISLDEAEELSKQNLYDYRPELAVQMVQSKEGGTCAIFSEQDGYDASRILLPDLFERLAPSLGGNFYVGIPARDLFVAMSAKPKAMIKRLRKRLNDEYNKLPYPIVPNLFYITQDGACAGDIE